MNTTSASDLTRRQFLGTGAAGAGLVVAFHIPFTGSAMAQAAAAAPALPPEINAWVVVQPDERVIVRIARSEMGQGTLTGLAQLVAEELECDWGRVTTESSALTTTHAFTSGGMAGAAACASAGLPM